MKPEKHEYKGRKIEIREEKGRRMLFLDGSPLSYGQFKDGKYFLRDYAYDWKDNLVDLTRRYVDHLAKVEKLRKAKPSRAEKGGS